MILNKARFSIPLILMTFIYGCQSNQNKGKLYLPKEYDATKCNEYSQTLSKGFLLYGNYLRSIADQDTATLRKNMILFSDHICNYNDDTRECFHSLLRDTLDYSKHCNKQRIDSQILDIQRFRDFRVTPRKSPPVFY